MTHTSLTHTSLKIAVAALTALSLSPIGRVWGTIAPTTPENYGSLEMPSPEPESLAMEVSLRPYIEGYAELVYRNYRDSHQQAVGLGEAIDAFLAQPNAATHQAAQQAWVQARQSYLQTEAFRFYEGPIDFIDPATGEEGPEGRINAWPMNEAFIRPSGPSSPVDGLMLGR